MSNGETPAPPALTAAPSDTGRSTLLTDHLAHFEWRVLQDALAEATADYWERRADTFAAVGNARCDRIAENCRFHAQLTRDSGLDQEARDAIANVLADQSEPVELPRIEVIR